MACQLNELVHIINGIYLHESFSQPLAVGQEIRAFLVLGDLPLPPALGHIQYLGGELLEHQIREAAAFLNRWVTVGERVLVVGQPDIACAVVVVMAYLIEYEGMDLANAYTLVAQNAYLVQLPADCFIRLIRAYELPYSAADVRDPYFTTYLINWVRETLSRIHRGVYIGGITALERQTRTREKGIEAVLRLDDSRRIGFQWSDQFLVCDMPLADGVELSGKDLDRGAAFIGEQVERGRNVLVHCEMGVSRSVTMVLAYLIGVEKQSLAQAYATVIKRRAIAHPHPRLFASLVQHFHLPYTLDEALDLDFYQCLLRESKA